MGNTVGSQGNKKEYKKGYTSQVREMKKLCLSERQREILIGTILGDGCLAENVWKKNYRLRIEQGDMHKEYVFWLYDIFRNLTVSLPKFNKERKSWRFYTISHPEITKLRKIFYKNRRKIVPKNIGDFFIHPLNLAVWFMDDGAARKDSRAYTLSVHCFSKKEISYLEKCLRNNFGLEIMVYWDRVGYRLYIPVRMAERFESLVLPYIIPSMKYKFPLTP